MRVLWPSPWPSWTCPAWWSHWARAAAWPAWASRVLTQSAFPVKPVDTTAAGDTFCGTLAAALSQGLALPQALALASAAGALACTALGAQSSIPRQADVAALVAATPATSCAG